MSALTVEITETLKSLDPKRAKALERAIHDLLIVVRPEAKSDDAPAPGKVEVDANGWPIGYWESVAGSWADLEFEAPDDLSIKEGEHVTLDAVLTNGGLIITRLVRRDPPLPDRKQAVAHFLKRWSGAGQPLTDNEIHSARTGRLLAKHVK